MFSSFNFDEDKFYKGCAALGEQIGSMYQSCKSFAKKTYERNMSQDVSSTQQRLINAKHRLAETEAEFNKKREEITQLEETLVKNQEEYLALKHAANTKMNSMVATHGLFAHESNAPITHADELETAQKEAEEKVSQIQEGISALNQELVVLINTQENTDNNKSTQRGKVSC